MMMPLVKPGIYDRAVAIAYRASNEECSINAVQSPATSYGLQQSTRRCSIYSLVSIQDLDPYLAACIFSREGSTNVVGSAGRPLLPSALPSLGRISLQIGRCPRAELLSSGVEEREVNYRGL